MSNQEIHKLSNAEKILLVERIWDSIDKIEISLTDAHKDELDRRLAKHHSGKNEYRSWQDVQKDLNKN